MASGKIYSVRIEDLLIVDSIENILSKLCTNRNIPYSEAVRFIFIKGFEYLATLPELETIDRDDKLNLKILTELQKIQFNENKSQYLYKLLEKMGKEDFTNWCTENNINPEPIIGTFDAFLARDAANDTRNIGLWLETELDDRMPHKYSSIIVAAQIAGILPDSVLFPDEYKSKLKTLSNIAASRGYSDRTRRGVWQKMLR